MLAPMQATHRIDGLRALRASTRAWALVLAAAALVLAFVFYVVSTTPPRRAPLPDDLSGIPGEFSPTLPSPPTMQRGPSVTAIRGR